MKTAPAFRANDKVTFRPGFTTESRCNVPRLEVGRVYCVREVKVVGGLGWVHLVGVRANKQHCEATRGVLPDTLQLVHRDHRDRRDEPEEAAWSKLGPNAACAAGCASWPRRSGGWSASCGPPVPSATVWLIPCAATIPSQPRR